MDTGKYVEGAVVVVQGTSMKASTGQLGNFDLRGLESGPVTLRVEVQGLPSRTVDVTVVGGERTRVPDIDLGGDDDVFTLDSFVVTLGEEVQNLEIAMQRDAPNVITAVGTEAYGNVGSNSVGNLLQYVPGLTVEGFDGEAFTASVRGMDPAFGSITSDGAKLAGQAEGGGGLNRAASVLDIGLVNFSEIEVIKAPTPDKAADSTGGVINLRTRSVFASREPSSGRVTLGMSAPMRKGAEFQSIDPNITFNYRRLLGDGSGDAKWGFTLNGAYSTRYLIRDQTTIDYETTFDTANPDYPYVSALGKQIGHQELNRRSFGANLEFRPNDTSRYLIGYKYNGSDRFADNRIRTWSSRGTTIGEVVLPDGYESGTRYTGGTRIEEGYTRNEVFWPRGQFSARGINVKLETEQHVWRFAADHETGPWKVSYDLNYSSYDRFNRSSRDWGGQTQLDIRDVGIRASGFQDSPDWDIEYAGGRGADAYADARTFRFDDLNRDLSENQVWSGKFDVTRYLDFERAPTYIKAGVSFDSGTQKQFPTVFDRYTFQGDLDGYGFADFKGRFGLDSDDVGDTNFNPLQDDWAAYFPGLLSAQAVRADVFDNNSDDWSAPSRRNGGYNRDRGWGEDISAGYIMAKSDLFNSKLSLLGGVRYERTEVSAYDNTRADPIAGTTFTADTDSYTDYYPSIHATWDFLPNWKGRLSHTKSIGRVNPTNIIPNITVNADDEGLLGTINVVNVGLEPRYVDNFDASIEYYPENGGKFSIGLFQKDMSNFIYSVSETVGIGPDNGFGGDYEGWELRTKRNGGKGEVKGWELDYRSPSLGNFVSWLEGFSVFANYTKLKATGDYGDEGSDILSGFKPETGNLGLAYRKSGTSVQVRANFRGEYLRFYNSNPARARWEFDQTKYDVNIERKITDNVSFYLDLINITNTNGRRFWGPPEEGRRLAWVDNNGPELYSGLNIVF